MKTIARGLLPQQFGFKQGHSNEVKEHNRALVIHLKHKAAHAHVDPTSPTTLCHNPIIMDILTKMWFADAEDSDDVRYQEYFVRGPSLAMIAQVLTVVHVEDHFSYVHS
ncbi:hypothetical protein SCP_0306310 [Sparassis crispa]|uniref:DUF6532 domain-containing protein n=1 Tax=Sparassis crispa TaxID=139825 RepID=A0A401GFG4_9APHY|nr:hypothetical protein SCP_0306310 [Sparassis crispa]GBE80910.1 hypothetical protein SCP_0306310 [Sparassis crispa]